MIVFCLVSVTVFNLWLVSFGVGFRVSLGCNSDGNNSKTVNYLGFYLS